MAANPKPIATKKIGIVKGNGNPKDEKVDYPGSIQFDSDGDYTIDWEDEHGKKKTYWDPQPTKVHKGLNDVQLTLSDGNHHKLQYTLLKDIQSGGGGTVKVGS